MVQIHFLGEHDQALCGRATGDGWLATVDPREVTCPACSLLLEAGREPSLPSDRVLLTPMDGRQNVR